MRIAAKVESLEKHQKARSAADLCEVEYKVHQGPAVPVFMPIEKALSEARTGRIKSINFPLSFNEQEAERAHGYKELDQIFDEVFNGINRDTSEATEKLILCSKPCIMAKQLPPKDCNGHAIGGNFATLDTGEEFHQSNYRELLQRRKAGFVIVQDYDESKEPWFNYNPWNKKGE